MIVSVGDVEQAGANPEAAADIFLRDASGPVSTNPPS